MNGVFIDTAPLIYLLEGSRPLRDRAREQLAEWVQLGFPLYSSVLTLTELLVPLKKSGNQKGVIEYKAFLSDLLSAPLRVIGPEEAELAADLRARHGFSAPDALQMAAAICQGCSVFYCNDRKLARCRELDVVFVN